MMKPFYERLCPVTAVAGSISSSIAGIVEKLVAFFKKLKSYQQKHSTIEKEALGLVTVLNHSRVYVSCGQTVVRTDHNPLVFLSKVKISIQRLLRWSLLSQKYDLQIAHTKGTDNAVPDLLSRYPLD